MAATRLQEAPRKHLSSAHNWDEEWIAVVNRAHATASLMQHNVLTAFMTNTLNVKQIAAKHNNWRGSQLCACGKLETSKHWVMCNRHASVRRRLFRSFVNRCNSKRLQPLSPDSLDKLVDLVRKSSTDQLLKFFTGRNSSLLAEVKSTTQLPLTEVRKEALRAALRCLEIVHQRTKSSRPLAHDAVLM